MTVHLHRRHAIQCEQLTHTLNMTLRNTQNIGAEEKLFQEPWRGRRGGEGGLGPGEGRGVPPPYIFFVLMHVWPRPRGSGPSHQPKHSPGGLPPYPLPRVPPHNFAAPCPPSRPLPARTPFPDCTLPPTNPTAPDAGRSSAPKKARGSTAGVHQTQRHRWTVTDGGWGVTERRSERSGGNRRR